MKVLIVDDSILLRNMLKEALKRFDFIEIVEARNGEEAIDKVLYHKPDIIIMDIDMPIMDGIEATREIMKTYPTPILIFSGKIDDIASYKAIKYGAVDIMLKPDIDTLFDSEFLKRFIEKLKELSEANISSAENSHKKIEPNSIPNKSYEIITIGASTGGPKAISQILQNLPEDFPLPIIIVQHIEDGFDKTFCQWLSESSRLNIEIAKEGTIPQKGSVYIAPTGKHLIIKDKKLSLYDGKKIKNQKPSIDVTLKSVATEFGDKTVGVLLTGMGNDGEDGALEIKNRGGLVIAESQETASIFGIPKAVIEAGAADYILPLPEIPKMLIKLSKK